MKKKISSLFLFLLLINLAAYNLVHGAAPIIINAEVLPADATALTATQIAPGSDEATLTWITSSNIAPATGSQRVEITGPQGPGIDFTTKDLTPFPGASTPDSYDNYAPNTNITGLVVGETYVIRHVSISGTLESLGVSILYIPAPANPPPNLLTAVANNDTSTLTWDNGGIDDPALECRLTASFDDFNVDPLAAIEEDSGWLPCPSSATIYDHTFTGLNYGDTYYYHVQTRDGGGALSAYSNVLSLTQPGSGGGGGGGRGGGSTATCGDGILGPLEQCDDGNRTSGDGCSSGCMLEPQVCGNGVVEDPEQCDDGNTVSGDGCSATCETEHAVAPVTAECGDDVVDAGEECDDGNLIDGDGCSAICEIEDNVVDVILEIRGAPAHRSTNLPEEQRTTNPLRLDNLGYDESIAQIGSADFFRINNTPNFGLNSQLDIFKPSINNLDVLGVTLDNWGNAEVPVTMVTGIYDFGLNGEAHNTRVIKTIDITETTERIVLDFSESDTQKLVAGDTRDDNYVNALDIATMLANYKETGANLNDLNKDESPIVNAIDIAILIWNYKAVGETF